MTLVTRWPYISRVYGANELQMNCFPGAKVNFPHLFLQYAVRYLCRHHKTIHFWSFFDHF